MLILFSVTLFVSAFLLFWTQLMVAKLILPFLGGSPSVWNTCLFFFQSVLLLGYTYAHWTTTRWHSRYQAKWHIFVLLLPLPLLPITLRMQWLPTIEGVHPVLWLLALLFFSVGLPFFVISTTAPLVQQWFSQTDQPERDDPYFLYAASNSGSLLGLLIYPTLIEPTLTLTQQRWVWTGGYGLLIVLVLGCAVSLWRSPLLSNSTKTVTAQHPTTTELPQPSLSHRQPAQWVVLAFLPSSLLLGVTTYVTTDLAAVPLLWAVPLIIYLCTFVLAFSRFPTLPLKPLTALLPLLLTPLSILFLLKIVHPLWLMLPLHLLGLFVAAYVFHSQLAESRPHPEHLTAFYVWISVGGVLGGLLNAIASPLLFTSVLEYPLVLVISLLLLQSPLFADEKPTRLGLRLTLPLAIGLLLGAFVVGFNPIGWQQNLGGIALSLGLFGAILYAIPLRWYHVGTGLVLLILLSQFVIGIRDRVIISDRSFYGVYRVLSSSRQGGYHSLLHGTTLHGKQSLDPNRRREPLTYFSRTGPVGQLFDAISSQTITHVGVLGLGVGTLAAYAAPHQHWTFYEIDPLAESLALNPQYFTFLQDAQAPVETVIGDGRLAIAHVPDQHYELLFMDAFSSDSIPVHLITREAVQLYFTKLTDHGLLVLNITNRFLDLEPMLGNLAEELGLASLEQADEAVSAIELEQGKTPSRWVIFARRAKDFGALRQDARWHPIADTSARLWTDDFSNIFQTIRFQKRN